VKGTSLYTSLEQALSKNFNSSPTEFSLDMEEVEKITYMSKDSMKMLIILAIKELPDLKGSLRDIKSKMLELFSDKLACESWEKTMLKTISRYKQVFPKI
jgi:hypothetical protein